MKEGNPAAVLRKYQEGKRISYEIINPNTGLVDSLIIGGRMRTCENFEITYRQISPNLGERYIIGHFPKNQEDSLDNELSQMAEFISIQLFGNKRPEIVDANKREEITAQANVTPA